MTQMANSPEPRSGARVLVTGTSSGIGLAAAEQLARSGAEVIMVSRDGVRGAEARDKVAAIATGRPPRLLSADLSSQASIRDLARHLHDGYDSIDVLINNAGTASRRRELTVDGIEKTFATNHLAPFLLTHLMIDLLVAAPAGRIVATTSESHSNRLDFDNLQGERSYNFFVAYARSKLANILFTYELARRLAGSRVTANCFTPGPTATSFGRGQGGVMGVMSALVHFLGQSAERSARTAVYLATSPEVNKSNGLYFFRGKPARSKPVTNDLAVAARLWTISEQLTNPGPAIGQRLLEAVR
jgi:NAD(P)-dependent dehydrogenase (short-subunit alcohol dehydrogenase family)